MNSHKTQKEIQDELEQLVNQRSKYLFEQGIDKPTKSQKHQGMTSDEFSNLTGPLTIRTPKKKSETRVQKHVRRRNKAMKILNGTQLADNSYPLVSRNLYPQQIIDKFQKQLDAEEKVDPHYRDEHKIMVLKRNIAEYENYIEDEKKKHENKYDVYKGQGKFTDFLKGAWGVIKEVAPIAVPLLLGAGIPIVPPRSQKVHYKRVSV